MDICLIPFRRGSHSKHNWRLDGTLSLLEHMMKVTRNFHRVLATDVTYEELKCLIKSEESYLGHVTYVERPEELCTDDSSVIDSIVYVLNVLEQSRGMNVENVHLCQVTSPMLLPGDITKASKVLKKHNSYETVVKVNHNDHFMNQRFVEDHKVKRLYERPKNNNKQNKPDVFKFGSLYSFKAKPFMEEKNILVEPHYADVIGKNRGIDIDDTTDLEMYGRYVARYYGYVR